MWDCLFLTVSEIAELLEHVKRYARHSFIYPMFVLAAHTGARRSEMVRSRLNDIDLTAGVVTSTNASGIRRPKPHERNVGLIHSHTTHRYRSAARRVDFLMLVITPSPIAKTCYRHHGPRVTG